MKLPRICLYLLLPLGFSLPLQAATQAELAALLRQHPIYQVGFSQQKTIPFLKKPFNSKGTLFFHHEKGILWQTEKPLQQSLLISPQGLFEVQDKKLVPLAEAQGANLFAAQLYEFFQGNFRGLEKSFYLQLTSESQGHRLTLTPRGEGLKKFLTKIQVQIDRKGRLQQIIILEPNQAKSQIRLGEYHPLKKLGVKERGLYDQIQP